MLKSILAVINRIPWGCIPDSVSKPLRQIQDSLTAFFKKQADDAAEAASKQLDETANLGKTTPDAPKTSDELFGNGLDQNTADFHANGSYIGNNAPRRAPQNLQEQLVLDEAKKGAGKRIDRMDPLTDPRYKGMEKWQHIHTNPDGTKINVHFVFDPKTGQRFDFKFKE